MLNSPPSPVLSEVKSFSGKKKLFLRGPSLELVGDSDSETSSPPPKSNTTTPHRYNLNVVAPSPAPSSSSSGPSIGGLPTTPKSINRRESIQSLDEISEESTDSD